MALLVFIRSLRIFCKRLVYVKEHLPGGFTHSKADGFTVSILFRDIFKQSYMISVVMGKQYSIAFRVLHHLYHFRICRIIRICIKLRTEINEDVRILRIYFRYAPTNLMGAAMYLDFHHSGL